MIGWLNASSIAASDQGATSRLETIRRDGDAFGDYAAGRSHGPCANLRNVPARRGTAEIANRQIKMPIGMLIGARRRRSGQFHSPCAKRLFTSLPSFVMLPFQPNQP
jgi:hypothetical protein